VVKRVMRNAKICSQCGREIDNDFIKSMRCCVCGKTICYKCNLGYKCNDCYVNSRNEYYVNIEI
jgi:hypothetical protein